MWRSDSERITELERAVETLTRRVALLEGKSPAFPTEKPKDMPSTIFQAKKSDGTLFVDYEFFPYMKRKGGNQKFEKEFEKLGFRLVKRKEEATEVAVVVFSSGARVPHEASELESYMKKIGNGFMVLYIGSVSQPPDFPSDLDEKIRTFKFNPEASNPDIPFGWIDGVKPRRFIGTQICSTCLSSATGSNTCNVCEETFCGMECFAYGHKDCYQ